MTTFEQFLIKNKIGIKLLGLAVKKKLAEYSPKYTYSDDSAFVEHFYKYETFSGTFVTDLKPCNKTKYMSLKYAILLANLHKINNVLHVYSEDISVEIIDNNKVIVLWK